MPPTHYVHAIKTSDGNPRDTFSMAFQEPYAIIGGVTATQVNEVGLAYASIPLLLPQLPSANLPTEYLRAGFDHLAYSPPLCRGDVFTQFKFAVPVQLVLVATYSEYPPTLLLPPFNIIEVGTDSNSQERFDDGNGGTLPFWTSARLTLLSGGQYKVVRVHFARIPVFGAGSMSGSDLDDKLAGVFKRGLYKGASGYPGYTITE